MVFLRLLLVLSIVALIQTPAFAQTLGDVSENVLIPLSHFRRAFVTIAVLVGVFFIFSAFMRYLRYRENQQEVPISTVIVYLLVGLVMIGLAFVYQWAIMADANFGMSDVAPT